MEPRHDTTVEYAVDFYQAEKAWWEYSRTDVPAMQDPAFMDWSAFSYAFLKATALAIHKGPGVPVGFFPGLGQGLLGQL